MSTYTTGRPVFQKGQTPERLPKPMKRTTKPTRVCEPGKMFVSPALRNFAKGQHCTLQMPWCNHDTETTVHCHIRKFSNAGASQKPHDFNGFHACSMCHLRENEAGWDDILRGLIITQQRIYTQFGSLTP